MVQALADICFIIPAYNEEGAIGSTISSIRTLFPNSRIVVCDNNSRDKTALEAAQYGAEVIYEDKRGKGNAVLRLFRLIDSDIYIMVDGDNTYDLNDLPQAVDKFIDGCYDMMVGDRFAEHSNSYMRPGHGFGNALFTRIIKAIFDINTNDLFSGLRIFSNGFVRSFTLSCSSFEIETELSVFASRMSLRVGEFPTQVKQRQNTESKLNTFKDGIKIAVFAVRLLHREYPYRIYLPLAIIFFLFSAYQIIQIYFSFLAFGSVLKMPTVIVSSSLLVASLVLFAYGIILNGLNSIRYEQRNIAYSRSLKK